MMSGLLIHRKGSIIRCKGNYKCRIYHGIQNNCYLKIGANKELYMDTLKYHDMFDIHSTSFFNCRMYQGLLDKDGTVKTVYFCSFACWGNQTDFLAASDKYTVKITKYSKFNNRNVDMNEQRFFLCRKRNDGNYMFESSRFPGQYLTWDGKSVYLSTFKFNENELLDENAENSQFEILNCALLESTV